MSEAAAAERRIFISYASDDAAVATQMREGLESSGLQCWIAPRDIDPGTSYPAAITAAARSCAVLVLLLTESSNQSPHVLSEVELAFNARRPILAVIVGTVTPSANLQYFISTTHWFDAEASFDDADLARLRTDLEKILAGERVLVEHEKGRPSRRPRIIAATALVVLVIGGYVMLRERGMAGPSPAIRTRSNPIDGQVYVWIPPGRFSMGCSPGDDDCESDEKPTHRVVIADGFWLARTEVTVAQYAARGGALGSNEGQPPNLPVADVTRTEASAYCTAVGGRLPTEAEWEYAARAGSTERYYGTLSEIAWYEENSDDHSHPVGLKSPNDFGLYDMLGNVYEWVFDRYYNAYDDADASVEEPNVPHASGVVRGGSWGSGPRDVRVTNRLDPPPDTSDVIIGFRCAMSGP